MDILDDMGVSKLSAKVFSKENYSFNLLAAQTWKYREVVISFCLNWKDMVHK